MTEPAPIRRPLTRELEDAGSPVRQFLDARFTSGLRDVQRRYRESAPPLAVPGVPRAEADPGTAGTAADRVLRFLICPQPELHLVMEGAAACRRAGIDVAPALAGIAGALGVPLPARPPERVRVFAGPVPAAPLIPGWERAIQPPTPAMKTASQVGMSPQSGGRCHGLPKTSKPASAHPSARTMTRRSLSHDRSRSDFTHGRYTHIRRTAQEEDANHRCENRKAPPPRRACVVYLCRTCWQPASARGSPHRARADPWLVGAPAMKVLLTCNAGELRR
jgi:hypothetical protein